MYSGNFDGTGESLRIGAREIHSLCEENVSLKLVITFLMFWGGCFFF